jgi:hypothetical protein
MDTNVPKRDRATSEPGGCECDECGTIFIGGLEHNLCAVCVELFDKCGHPLDAATPTPSHLAQHTRHTDEHKADHCRA